MRPVRDQYAFIPTSSQWTAYFDNGPLGTDAEADILYLSKKIDCLGIKLVACPHTIVSERKEAKGSYGGLGFYYTAPNQEKDLRYSRLIDLTNDAGRWHFTNLGTPFSFETPEMYLAKSKLDRFTFNQLKQYLGELGIDAFEENYYKSLEIGAVMIEKPYSSI